MINEHDIKDLARNLVQKSFGEEVPEAAMPSLVKFMHEVAKEAAGNAEYMGFPTVARDIRVHFGVPNVMAALLRRKPVSNKPPIIDDCGGGK